jgi:hypothetical protein
MVAIGNVDASKPAPSWSCSVQLRDSPGDIVKSDGAGTYVNGQSGVSCSIDGFSGWLDLRFANSGKRAPARSLVVVGQVNTDGSYNTISSGAELDIKFLSLAVAPLDVLPWRLRVSSSQFQDGFGQFTGDSAYDAGPAVAGTSSLAIATIDACTWQVTSYTTGFGLQTLSHGENATTGTDPRIALLTEVGIPGTSQAVVRGQFVMPFAATIRVIGGKPGCSL